MRTGSRGHEQELRAESSDLLTISTDFLLINAPHSAPFSEKCELNDRNLPRLPDGFIFIRLTFDFLLPFVQHVVIIRSSPVGVSEL